MDPAHLHRPPSPTPLALGRIQTLETKCTTNKEPGSYAHNVYMYSGIEVNLLLYDEGAVAPLLYPFVV